MTAQQIDRRSNAGRHVRGGPAAMHAVTSALLIQYRTGTVSAIEYLKAHAVDAGVIERVLSGAAIRAVDKSALDAAGAGARA